MSYQHAGPSSHPARDLADAAELTLGIVAATSLGTAVIVALVLLGASWPLLGLAFVGLGALLSGVYRVQDRREYVDVPADGAKEANQ